MTEQRWIDVPGGRLFALADGDGPPIVLLHAGIAHSGAWDPLVPLLTSAGYRAIRYDARGFGRTETEDVEYRNVSDLIAVLDAFGVERACLVGNSRGGVIAFDAAVAHPARVTAVVLLASNVSGHEPEPTADEAAAYERMEALEEAGDLAALVEFEIGLWVDGPRSRPGRVPPALTEWLRPMITAAEDPDRVRGRALPEDPPAALRLDAVTMPILAVVGGLDLSDNEATARFLEVQLPDVRVVVLPDVAHLVAVEAPEETARLVLDHLRPLGAFG